MYCIHCVGGGAAQIFRVCDDRVAIKAWLYCFFFTSKWGGGNIIQHRALCCVLVCASEEREMGGGKT